MFSTLCNAILILSLLRSLALASVVSCVENSTRLASFHNSFWEKQVSGLVFTPHNGVAAASRQSHRASIISLSHTHTCTHASAHAHSHKSGSLPACTLICKYVNMHACTHIYTSTPNHISPSGTAPYFSGNKGYSNR